MGRTNVIPQHRPMMLLLQTLQNTGHFRIQIYGNSNGPDYFMIEVTDQTARATSTWKAKVPLDEAALQDAGVNRMDDEFENQLWNAVCRVLKSIPEHQVGKYPATRLYSDLHLTAPKLLFNPFRDVDGWIHNKYRGKGPREQDIVKLSDIEMTVEGRVPDPDDEPDKDDLLDRLSASVFLKNTTPLTTEHTEEVKKLATAAKKKKVVNVVKPTIDPSKVKKIKCPKHTDRAMVFDPVKQKWKCPAQDCKMTARPVKDEDDRSVQIGKGSTSLRVVADGRDTVVLLVSDDNLALNITPLLNLEDFLRQNGILDLAKTASENGRNEFVDSTERPVQLEMKIGVIGADDLIDNFDD